MGKPPRNHSADPDVRRLANHLRASNLNAVATDGGLQIDGLGQWSVKTQHPAFVDANGVGANQFRFFTTMAMISYRC